jgi:CheY-like chemotaxis protein
MDGYAALRALKADPRTAHVPTVALTAQAMKGDEQAVLAAGFDGYNSKPIDSRTFSTTVARLLGST